MAIILAILSTLLLGHLMIENISNDNRTGIQTFAHKSFYIPKHNLIVYCHEEDGMDLILGGMTRFVSDSKTVIIRQKISKFEFCLNYSPIEMSNNKLESYPFLIFVESVSAYRTISESSWNHYLEHAEKLKSVSSKNWDFPFVNHLYY